MSGISTHILNTSLGKPAKNVLVRLEKLENDKYISLCEGNTNSDGRFADLLGGRAKTADVYRLSFDTGAYFHSLGQKCFYPSVQIDFEITDPDSHHHVPLLLSPFGFSTYRGS